MTSWRRTHTCGELTLDAVGTKVTLMGWVDVVRDLGGILFIELRDREGVTQLLIGEQASTEVMELAKRVSSEWVVAVQGEVLRRTEH